NPIPQPSAATSTKPSIFAKDVRNPVVADKPKPAFKKVQRTSQPNARKVEIHGIFPTNFVAAASKGKTMVYFEAVISGSRTPLASLPLNESFQFEPEDITLLDVAEEIAGGDTPSMLMLASDSLGKLLNALKGHPRLSLGKTHDLEVEKDPMKLHVEARLEPAGEITLRLRTTLTPQLLIPGEVSWIFKQETFCPIVLPKAAKDLLRGPVTISRGQIPVFLSQDWAQLNQHCEVQANFKLEDFSLAPLKPKVQLLLKGGLAHLQADLQFDYGARKVNAGSGPGEMVWIPDPAMPTRYATRDLGLEEAAVQRLKRNGFTGPHSEGAFQLVGQASVLTFFSKDYYKLQKEWNVTLEERLEKSTAQNLERIEPEFNIISSGEQWFDLDVAFKSAAGAKFSSAEIQRLLRSGQNHTRLPNGKFALIDTGAVEELQEVLLDCSPQQHEGVYRINNQQAGFLTSAIQQQGEWTFKAPPHWLDRAAKLHSQADLPPPDLGPLENLLRPYQKLGVGWMHFLRKNRFGGILADEMGLGKTLQTLAFLQTAREANKSARTLSLVVCPTSLVFNWVEEAKKFTPDLKVLALRGAKRAKLFDQIPTADLVITSYALIRRDAEQYRQHEFDTVILDEAQHIKNRQTQNAVAVKSIRARNRLVLTGTPIENSVLDLWSIFDFLMPGYLGAAKDFRERYELPIAKDRNSDAQGRLTRRIKPLLLRRLKQEVARDLPEKIEMVSYCELTDDQQAVYQQLLESSRQQISDATATQGIQRSRMIMLSALLRLRQICCDLRLLKLANVDADKASGKLDLFNELLQEVVDGGHRVLVFSQFVEMLSLLKESLSEQGIEYSYLDGSTNDRQGAVADFQASTKPVFLISLKAGGVGLNLTGADTVIHFDPWWNPAVEDQATDRAHRIGQKKVVTSYKLITRNTVEEKILNLQTKKREVIKATLGGEEQFAGSLSVEELQSLFD
ncbi:MAG: DEAD/DEAH box helicase, partial [Verrucomicrobiales bacterium]